MAQYEFVETRYAIEHLDSEESLSEHLDYLDSLADLTGYDATQAKKIVSERLAELEEPDHSEYRPSFSGHGRASPAEFGDAEISSLFGTLVKLH
jgi:hypothetical protein